MANTIHVDVVSAEEQIFSGEAEFVVLPGILGELGIYPRHTPLLTQIKPGAVRIKVPGQDEDELVFVQGGFLEVQPHLVTVLADTAVRAKDLDEVKAARSEARRARGDAEQDLARGNRHRRGGARRCHGATRSDPQDAPPRLTGRRRHEKGGHEPPFLLPEVRAPVLLLRDVRQDSSTAAAAGQPNGMEDAAASAGPYPAPVCACARFAPGASVGTLGLR